MKHQQNAKAKRKECASPTPRTPVIETILTRYQIHSDNSSNVQSKVIFRKINAFIFEFALLTGMRPEEYLSLQWKDLDFERNTAQVKRALVWHRGKWTFEQPKTNKSRRIVFLPQTLVNKLEIHKNLQNDRRLKYDTAWENNDLIFCCRAGTPQDLRNLTYRYFRPILKKAGLPQIRLYDLRHTHATLLLIAGENPKIVAERLGHSGVALTLDTYSHVLPTMQKSAIEKLNKMLYSTRV